MFRTPKLVVLIAALAAFSFACQLSLPFGYTIEEVQKTAPTADAPPVVSAPTQKPIPVIPTTEPTVAAPTLEPTVALPTPTTEPTEEPAPTEIAHLVIPVTGLPEEKPQVVYDQESDRKAAQKEAYAGDEFLTGRYERPFDQEMNYIPFVDIKQTNFYRSKDGEYYFAIIYLMDDPALLKDKQTGFGIEIDEDVDGRGNTLVWTKRPLSTEWSVDGVSIWKDANLSIGAKSPMLSDAPAGADGFEVNIFDAGVGSDPDMAWSRISPKDPARIEITFKKSVLGESQEFLWAAWAILGEDQFNLFDHNDYYTFEEAGSAMRSDKGYYPLNEMFGLDNTCRSASGFTPKGNEPGICPKAIQPAPEKDEPNCRFVPCTVFSTMCSPKWVCD